MLFRLFPAATDPVFFPITIVLGVVFLLILLLSIRRRGNRSLEMWRRVFVGALLAVLIPLAMIHGIQTFMPEPLTPKYFPIWDFEDEELKLLEQIGDTAKSEKLKDKISQKKQAYDKKYKQYKKDMTEYVRIRRIIAFLIGVTSIIIGSFLADYFLGAGFIIGGVLCIANATTAWWYRLSEATRFLIIISAILLLFIVGYLLVRRERKKM